MDKQPGNRHWLQNMNNRQQTRPGPTGRPNWQTPQPGPFSSLNRWLLIIVLVMLGIFIYNYFNTLVSNNNAPQRAEMTYNDFYNQIAAKNIKSATFIGQTDITGEFVNPVNGQTRYHVVQLPNGDPLLPQLLIKSGAQVVYQPPADNGFWVSLLINFLPWIFLIGLFVFLSRRATQGQQGIFSFGKSRAKLILEDRPSTTFADVATALESAATRG